MAAKRKKEYEGVIAPYHVSMEKYYSDLISSSTAINRAFVAEICRIEVIEKQLMADKDVLVREMLAGNTKRIDILEELSHDRNQRVRREVAKRKGLFAMTLYLLSIDKVQSVAEEAIRHLEDPEVLRMLAINPDSKVRENLANFTTDRNILKLLANDRNERVAISAVVQDIILEKREQLAARILEEEEWEG